ncbi:MAG: hypothetical protein KGO96_06320 [Elusimicrobia bacterium]|nr:hypothetical protein [Elusimicrobiota bacterium]MDE2236952.1 hypothetical protein [Elusimicrobiota bacterium]MDE2425505.1 hypothetical protein [Elusimicrobiota bacterium]
MTKTAPGSPRNSRATPETWDYFRRCLFSPERAAQDASAPGSLRPALWIYAAFLLASAVFYAKKPFDFPDRLAAFPRQAQGFWFWLKVMAWQPPLELAWIAFLLALFEWLKEGRLFWRLLGGVAATAAPFVLLLAYRYSNLGRGACGLLFAAWLGLLALWARRAQPEFRRSTTSLMLALNAIGLALLLPMTAAVASGWATLFKASQIAGGLWMLACGTLGLRALGRSSGQAGLRLSRCAMAVLLSMFMQVAFAFILYMLGLVPIQILKALLYS